jgi:hypothetical protein
MFAIACCGTPGISSVQGQTHVGPVIGPQIPNPIDQTVSDLNPLSASFRHMTIDLRMPTGFKSVYTVPGRDDLLMRANGSVYAVFPYSVYNFSKKGKSPEIPASTVFYIGQPPGAETGTSAMMAATPPARVRSLLGPMTISPATLATPTTLGPTANINGQHGDQIVMQDFRTKGTRTDAEMTSPPQVQVSDLNGDHSKRSSAQLLGQRPSLHDPLIHLGAARENDEDQDAGDVLKDSPQVQPNSMQRGARLDPNANVIPDAALILERGGPSLISTDSAYRISRIAQLLHQAAQAEKAHAPIGQTTAPQKQDD